VLTGVRRQFSAMLPESLLKPSCVLLAVLVSVIALKSQATVLLLGIICAGFWLTAGFQAWLMYSTPVAPTSGDECDESGRWRTTGWPWMFITLIWDYFIELHLLLAAAAATTAEVAVLHICFRLRVLAGFGTRALYALVLPDLYGANAAGNEREVRASLARANALALAYAIAVCAGVWLIGGFVLGLVGDSFSDAHTALIVMCLTIVVRAIFGPATAVLSMKGIQLPSLWTLIAGLVISMVLSLVLLPPLGVLGIAIAYLIANSAIAVCQWHLALRMTGIDVSIFAGLWRAGPVAGTPERSPAAL
jgi:O-antigen/teichoic acid export membrane protein